MLGGIPPVVEHVNVLLADPAEPPGYSTNPFKVVEFPLLTPRLVDGDADPGGSWRYGRLEAFDGETFVLVADSNRNQGLGRRGAIVACRTFGFATGGQALAGEHSALPDVKSRDTDVGNIEIMCAGDEANLTDCKLEPGQGIDYNYVEVVEERAVALVCYNPSGTATSSSMRTSTRKPQLDRVPLGGQPGFMTCGQCSRSESIRMTRGSRGPKLLG